MQRAGTAVRRCTVRPPAYGNRVMIFKMMPEKGGVVIHGSIRNVFLLHKQLAAGAEWVADLFGKNIQRIPTGLQRGFGVSDDAPHSEFRIQLSIWCFHFRTVSARKCTPKLSTWAHCNPKNERTSEEFLMTRQKATRSLGPRASARTTW